MDGKNSVALRHTWFFFLQNRNPRQLTHRSTLPVNVKFIFKFQYVSLRLPESTICEWTARHCLYSCKCFQKCIFKHLCDSVVVDRVLLFAEKMRQEHVIIFGTGGGFAPLDCFATRKSKKNMHKILEMQGSWPADCRVDAGTAHSFQSLPPYRTSGGIIASKPPKKEM